MSGRGIGDLGRPERRRRMDLGKNARLSGFETNAESRRENCSRAKGLRWAAKKYPDKVDAKAANELADRLEAGSGRDVPDSLASSVRMRDYRINVTGALWELIRTSKRPRPVAITIVPRTWRLPEEQLYETLPAQLMAALENALYRRGAAKANGWLIVFLHGEYDPISGTYQLHVHGYAQGEMVEVVRRLRQLPNYKTQKFGKDGKINSVYRPVRISLKRPKNRRRQIVYRLQSYWPAKAIVICDDGQRIRAKRRKRIPEPHHSRLLLWLDRFKLADLTLMFGLRVTKSGLVQTKPSASRTSR